MAFYLMIFGLAVIFMLGIFTGLFSRDYKSAVAGFFMAVGGVVGFGYIPNFSALAGNPVYSSEPVKTLMMVAFAISAFGLFMSGGMLSGALLRGLLANKHNNYADSAD